MAEEETHDDKPSDKGQKQFNKEKYYSSIWLHAHNVTDLLRRSSYYNDLRYFKGFAQKIYMPPEVA